MIKNIFLLFILVFSSSNLAVAQPDFKKINGSNTWLKLGINGAAPILDFRQTHQFGLGLDASIQFLETKATGIGVKVGLLNYFGKENNANVQALPLAVMLRYYPKARGWFTGGELGYAFLNGLEGTAGGIFFRPQLGLHFDYWNYFLYYDHILIEEAGVIDLQAIGLGITYNLRFKK